MSAAPNEIGFIPPATFQQIIRNRRTEHKAMSERKRQDDLRRIQDMKSSTGLNPLERFPKEIWAMILNELNPEDKRSMGQVHDTFRDLMGETYVGDVLLPQILGFKVRRCWLWPKHELQFWNANLRKHFAMYSQLRLVSQTMRKAVDQWFENDLIGKLNFKQSYHFSLPSIIASFQLFEESDYHRLLTMIEDPFLYDESMRFFIRSLRFVYPERTESRHYFSEDVTYSLLDRIGDQIWFFSFEVDGTHSSDGILCLTKLYTILLEWLKRMPNLKWLSLRLVFEEENHTFDVPSDLLQPTLGCLERVDLNCNVPQFATTILSANPNIKILSFLENDSLDYNDISGIQSFPVECLSIDRWEGWRNPLQSIACQHWPLKSVHLGLKSPEPVYSTFRYLSNYKTLEKLSLRVFDTNLGNDIAYLELPNLLNFEVLFNKPIIEQWNDRTYFFMTLQYLLNAGKLNELSWHCAMTNHEIDSLCQNLENYDLEDGKITFGGVWPDLSRSNIYQVFPSMNSIKILLYIANEKRWKFNKTFNRK